MDEGNGYGNPDQRYYQGSSIGYENGYNKGVDVGYREGEQGKKTNNALKLDQVYYPKGYRLGNREGYEMGYKDGYEDGYSEGKLRYQENIVKKKSIEIFEKFVRKIRQSFYGPWDQGGILQK
ncbi:hypothetical protein BB561_006377 [Smittium simulii]|uniref:Essential protein Yae1 N-terminal domain-containing protein n=1 Tax=Smittium simulii TaxID=133385 RepID=A0A2T9Y4R7_9FUNG|nr:hypothetical protein BB561_006377 [Smittium simulii]